MVGLKDCRNKWLYERIKLRSVQYNFNVRVAVCPSGGSTVSRGVCFVWFCILHDDLPFATIHGFLLLCYLVHNDYVLIGSG